jgi:septum formation protein
MIYLASASPRRAELLKQIGLSFSVVSADIDETRRAQESPHDYVLRLAQEKAEAGWRKAHAESGDFILAADTSVVSADLILGKPQNEEDALVMRRVLSGTSHQVLTALCWKTATQIHCEVCSTTVYMREINEQEWRDYWRSGEPRDKAGGYAIQGNAARFITRIEGSYSNVVGLPLHLVDQFWRASQGELA